MARKRPTTTLEDEARLYERTGVEFEAWVKANHLEAARDHDAAACYDAWLDSKGIDTSPPSLTEADELLSRVETEITFGHDHTDAVRALVAHLRIAAAARRQQVQEARAKKSSHAPTKKELFEKLAAHAQRCWDSKPKHTPTARGWKKAVGWHRFAGYMIEMGYSEAEAIAYLDEWEPPKK